MCMRWAGASSLSSLAASRSGVGGEWHAWKSSAVAAHHLFAHHHIFWLALPVVLCRADTVMQLFEVVQSTPVTFPEGVAVSGELQELLLGMLEKVCATHASCSVTDSVWLVAAQLVHPAGSLLPGLACLAAPAVGVKESMAAPCGCVRRRTRSEG